MHFTRAVGDAALVWIQNPLRLADDSEPQPELMLLRPKADFYRSGHPRPDDVLLLVEVADTTVAFDRGPSFRSTRSTAYPRSGSWISMPSGSRSTANRAPAATAASSSGGDRVDRTDRAADGGAPGRRGLGVIQPAPTSSATRTLHLPSAPSAGCPRRRRAADA